jgi:hypothetical protein
MLDAVHGCCGNRGSSRHVPACLIWLLLLLLLLVQAAICPAFVSRPDGRKFLSCLLTVHPSMVQEMTSVIHNQVGACATMLTLC